MIVINSANCMLASLCILNLENLKHVILVVKSVQELIFRFLSDLRQQSVYVTNIFHGFLHFISLFKLLLQ